MGSLPCLYLTVLTLALPACGFETFDSIFNANLELSPAYEPPLFNPVVETSPLSIFSGRGERRSHQPYSRDDVINFTQDRILNVLVGSSIRLNCTILNLTSEYNSSALLFTRNNTYMPREWTRVINSRTVLATIPWARFNESVNFFCLPDRNKDDASFRQSIRVLVGYPPLPPVLDRCIVHKWRNFNCTWGPTQQKQHEQNNVGQLYSAALWRKEGTENWTECVDTLNEHHEERLESCKVRLTPDLLAGTYQVKVKVSNAFGTQESNITTVVVKQTVYPTPVNDLLWTANGGGASAQLSWQTPVTKRWRKQFSNISLQYGIWITYFRLADWNQTRSVESFFTTSDTHVTLPTVPYACYDVTVTSRVLPAGVWGENATKRGQSGATAPSRRPKVFPAIQTLSAAADDRRRAVIYWRPLPVMYHNGRDLRYEVTAEPEELGDGLPVVRGTTKGNHTELILLNNVSYSVTVLSRNHAGVSGNLSADPLIISPAQDVNEMGNEMLGDINLVAEGRDKSLHLHWNPVDNLTTYTIYWCEGHSQADGLVCKGELKQLAVTSRMTQANVTMTTSYTRALVGIAGTKQGDHVGVLRMTSCVYNADGVPEPPNYVTYNVTDTSSDDVIIRWHVKECEQSVKGGFILQYLIVYCNIDGSDSCSATDGNVTVVVSGRESRTRLPGLEAGDTYRVWVYSVSRAGVSEPSEFITLNVPSVTLYPVILKILIAAAVLSLVLIVIPLVSWKCYKFYHDYAADRTLVVPPEHYRISLLEREEDKTDKDDSPTTRVRPASESSGTTGYCSQLEEEEADSTRGSLSGYAQAGHEVAMVTAEESVTMATSAPAVHVPGSGLMDSASSDGTDKQSPARACLRHDTYQYDVPMTSPLLSARADVGGRRGEPVTQYAIVDYTAHVPDVTSSHINSRTPVSISPERKEPFPATTPVTPAATQVQGGYVPITGSLQSEGCRGEGRGTTTTPLDQTPPQSSGYVLQGQTSPHSQGYVSQDMSLPGSLGYVSEEQTSPRHPLLMEESGYIPQSAVCSAGGETLNPETARVTPTYSHASINQATIDVNNSSRYNTSGLGYVSNTPSATSGYVPTDTSNTVSHTVSQPPTSGYVGHDVTCVAMTSESSPLTHAEDDLKTGIFTDDFMMY